MMKIITNVNDQHKKYQQDVNHCLPDLCFCGR